MIKLDTYYDLHCYNCGRHWSTDFEHGFAEEPKQLRLAAKLEGWVEVPGLPGRAICPICSKLGKDGVIHK